MKCPSLLMLALALGFTALSGCMHVAGDVVDTHGKPVADAEISNGHPNGLGPYSRYKVNSKGEFSFWIMPTDENFIYVWDGKGDGLIGPRKIDRSEISDHMHIVLKRADSEF